MKIVFLVERGGQSSIVVNAARATTLAAGAGR
jgi:hypothetical protein